MRKLLVALILLVALPLGAARNFDGVDDQLLITSGVHAFTPEDWTVACFVKLNSYVDFAGVFLNGDAVTAGGRSGFMIQASNNDKLLINVKTGSDSPTNSVGTTAIVNGIWYHIGGSKLGTTLKYYQDGVNEDTDTTASATMDYTADAPQSSIGNHNENIETDGVIAECAVWSVALIDAEWVSLAKGFSPLLVRPEKLLGYWPILGRSSPEPDLIQGQDGVLTGTTVASHPRVLYPTQPISGFAAAAVPPAGKRRPIIIVELMKYMPAPILAVGLGLAWVINRRNKLMRGK